MQTSTQPAFTYSTLTIETLEQGVKNLNTSPGCASILKCFKLFYQGYRGVNCKTQAFFNQQVDISGNWNYVSTV